MLASDKEEKKMTSFRATRRRFIQAGGGISLVALLSCNQQGQTTQQEQTMTTLYTFGDSILDCGSYNEFGVHPGQLLVQNDDRLFPEFHDRDLASQGSARLEHRAINGSTVADLPAQARGLQVEGKVIAVITIGGNDLLRGLIQDTGSGIVAFSNAFDTFVQQLPIRPVLLGNVYDPTVGDDRRNFVGADPAIARKNLQRVNTAIEEIANRYGKLVDLHTHFLTGDPSWFTSTIEPSLRGVSEVRRAFLPYVIG